MVRFERTSHGVKVRCLNRLATPLYLPFEKAARQNEGRPLCDVGWAMGFEPMVSRATIWRFNQLSYVHHMQKKMARQKGLEPLTHCLEGSCSIQLSYWRKYYGAGDGNRTHVTSLEGWNSTIELHPHGVST